MKKTITLKELLQILLVTIMLSSVLVGFGYIATVYNKSKYSYFYYKQEAEKLQNENDSLLKKVNENKIMIQKYQHNIDSIVELKKK
jgi:uncharacterized protein YlxW (UPF0749 family)